MKPARLESRPQRYGDLGRVLAQTATAIGVPIAAETEDRWVNTLVCLAPADDISETTPELLEEPGSWSRVFGLDGDNPELATAWTNLLAASRYSRGALNLRDHFTARSLEATSSADLLRFQSPEKVRDNDGLWGQLGSLTVLGTHFDSLLDCREDALELPQFTAAQLARGAAFNMIKTMGQIRRETLVACVRACHVIGIDTHIAKRLPKPLLGIVL